MGTKATLVWVLLAAVVFTSSVEAGGGFYFDRAAFEGAPGLFYDVYVDYFSGTYAAGTLINSMVYPSGGVFDSNTVPIIDSAIKSLSPVSLQFVDGAIATTDPRYYLGIDFLGGGEARSGGFYMEYLDPVQGDTTVMYALARIEDDTLLYARVADPVQPQFVGFVRPNLPTRLLEGLYAYVYGYDDFNTFGATVKISHMVLESRYLSSGGDPHIKSSVIDALLPGLVADDHVNLFRHPEMVVNARLRSFEFLDFEDATYYGAVGVGVANGDRLQVEAYEAQDGSAAFRVTLNGKAVEMGSAMAVEAGAASYEVHYDRHGAVPHGRAVSVFHRDYPYMQHEAVVRVVMAGIAAVDIDLAWKDAFVDWHQATPKVYRQAGAFLNVAVRDLVQESRSEAGGLLKVTDQLQRVKLAIEEKAARASEAGDSEAHRRSVEASEQLNAMLGDLVAQHQVDSLF